MLYYQFVALSHVIVTTRSMVLSLQSIMVVIKLAGKEPSKNFKGRQLFFSPEIVNQKPILKSKLSLI
jgi:hypothetical protein